MSTEPNDKHYWTPHDVQACSDQTRELFTDTMRFMAERYCPNIGMALTATAILTLATVIHLHHVRRLKGQSHE
jgi:hypothetical protein